jgi:hypothetical protein
MSVHSSEQKKKSPSRMKWAKNRRRLGIMWPIESEGEVNAHAPTGTQQCKCEQGARRDHQRSTNYLYLL